MKKTILEEKKYKSDPLIIFFLLIIIGVILGLIVFSVKGVWGKEFTNPFPQLLQNLPKLFENRSTNKDSVNDFDIKIKTLPKNTPKLNLSIATPSSSPVPKATPLVDDSVKSTQKSKTYNSNIYKHTQPTRYPIPKYNDIKSQSDTYQQTQRQWQQQYDNFVRKSQEDMQKKQQESQKNMQDFEAESQQSMKDFQRQSAQQLENFKKQNNIQ